MTLIGRWPMVFLLLVSTLLVGGCGEFDHGTELKIGTLQLFYKDPVTAGEAQELGNYLVNEQEFGAEYLNTLRVVPCGSC